MAASYCFTGTTGSSSASDDVLHQEKLDSLNRYYHYIYMASVNTQFSIAVHVLAAIAHYETSFTSEVLAGSVNANPIFVKRIMAKLSKAKLVKATVGKSGGYALAKSPKEISLLDVSYAIKPPDVFAIHTYEKKKWCVVSNNIKEVMSDVLVGTQKAVDNDLKRTTIADVVSKIRGKSKP
ncbi:MAG: Rrf2 family transcriptional regulator [Proteobacteria bacterium]|nr:MAG: Rrf2 family transcriptional regulator [Pseudomonadota bacterium]